MIYPKNLSQFIRNAKDMKLRMVSHSWYPNGELIGLERKVKTVQSKAIQFEPHKESSNGSWLRFDNGVKAVRFEESYITIDLDGLGEFKNTMVYKML